MYEQTVMSNFGRRYCCYARWLECSVFKNYRIIVVGFIVADHNSTFRKTKFRVILSFLCLFKITLPSNFTFIFKDVLQSF